MSKEKMEAIFLKRVSECQDNLHHAKRAYEQAQAELSRAKADLIQCQIGNREEARYEKL